MMQICATTIKNSPREVASKMIQRCVSGIMPLLNEDSPRQMVPKMTQRIAAGIMQLQNEDSSRDDVCMNWKESTMKRNLIKSKNIMPLNDANLFDNKAKQIIAADRGDDMDSNSANILRETQSKNDKTLIKDEDMLLKKPHNKKKKSKRRGFVQLSDQAYSKTVQLIIILIVLKARGNNANQIVTKLVTKPIIFGNSATLQCCFPNNELDCDEGLQLRWTKGNTQKTLFWDGHYLNKSKYDIDINPNCTCMNLNVKNFGERDLDEYTCCLLTLEATISRDQLIKYSVSIPQVEELTASHELCSSDNSFIKWKITNAYPLPVCYLHDMTNENIGVINTTFDKASDSGIMLNVEISAKLVGQKNENKLDLRVICSLGPKNITLNNQSVNCKSLVSTIFVVIVIVSLCVFGAMICQLWKRNRIKRRKASGEQNIAEAGQNDNDATQSVLL